MLELHPYLKRVYEDEIVDCMMCREIAIRVSTCMVILFSSIIFPFYKFLTVAVFSL